MIVQKTLFLLLISYTGLVNGSGYDMSFNNFTCTSDDPKGFIDKLSCFVSKNVKRRTFTIEFQLKKDFGNFLFNMRVQLPRKDGNNFKLFNLSNLNGCNWVSNKNQITLVKLGRSNLDRFSNFPHNCPFQKETLYYIRGFRTDMSMFPAFAFEADMWIWFDIVVERNKIIQGFLMSSITPNKNNKNVRG